MKDGRTHLAHKAEHAIDLDSGALVAVTLQDADQGDTTTLVETAIAAAEQVEAAHAKTDDAPGAAGDRRGQGVSQQRDDGGSRRRRACGRTSRNPTAAVATGPTRRTAQAPVYGNRRRIRGARGGRLRRRRAELAERSFAHLYDTGGMRRTHLRGHDEHPEAPA